MQTDYQQRSSAGSPTNECSFRPKKKVRTKLFDNSPTENSEDLYNDESSCDVPETDSTNDFGESSSLKELSSSHEELIDVNSFFDDEFASFSDRIFCSVDEVRNGMMSPIDKLLQIGSTTGPENESSEASSPMMMSLKNEFQSSPDRTLSAIAIDPTHSMEMGSMTPTFTSMVPESTEENLIQEILLSELQKTQSPGNSMRRLHKRSEKDPQASSRHRGDGIQIKKERRARGLRDISLTVTNKVERKGKSTYDEVAAEVIAEFIDPNDPRPPEKLSVVRKNIRRRVYDTLNVLNALNIIYKKKQAVRWLGDRSIRATYSQNFEMKDKVLNLKNKLEMKSSMLQELEKQTRRLQTLIDRNQSNYIALGQMPEKCIRIPFTLVEIPEEVMVVCEVSKDKGQLYLYHGNRTQLPVHNDGCVVRALENSWTNNFMAPNLLTHVDCSHNPVHNNVAAGGQCFQNCETLSSDFGEMFDPEDLMTILFDNKDVSI